MKTNSPFRLVIYVCLITFFSCENDFGGTVLPEENTKEETDIDFKTVSFDKTEDFLERFKNSKTYKTANPIGLEIDESSLRHADIQNTDQKITILDASTKFKNVQSHIFQIEIDGDFIRTILLSSEHKKVPRS